jgi:hypothetical protein
LLLNRHVTHYPLPGVLSEIAFHEKAGRSQVDPSLPLLNKLLISRRVATVAMLPSALSRSDFISPGACWAFSFQPVLPSVCRPVVRLFEWKQGQAINAITGTRPWVFVFSLFGTVSIFVLSFVFYAAAATVVRLLWCNGSYASPLAHG